MPNLPLPPFTQDVEFYLRWYTEAWNAWNYGENPDSDPRRLENFVTAAQAIGKDTTDITTLGGPSFTAPPQPEPTPLPETPPETVSAPQVLDASNQDIGPLIAAAAAQYALPAWALHACLIAESGLNPRAERWGDRSARARELTARLDVDSGDEAAMNGLTVIMDDLRSRGLHMDCSFGYSQLIWATAAGYGIGNGEYTLANLLDVRLQLFDRSTSINLGARHLALCCKRVRDTLGEIPEDDTFILNALATYNSGSVQRPNARYWTDFAANVRSYQSAMRQAWAAWN